MAQQKTSDFYWACRNGDVNAVKKILPNLKLNDINRIESNGSTALHAASYYGHANVVRLLLEHDADTTLRNKYDKTAKDEASTDEVRTLFEQADDDDIPQSEVFQVYRNADGMNKSALATRILKARLGTYQAHKYSISEASNIEYLENKYRKKCEENGHTKALEIGTELFKAFRETGNFDHMIRLYTMTPFHRVISNDETFHIEMYKHLLRYDEHRVKNHVCHAARLLPSDLAFFQWGIDHPNSLLEIRRILSTKILPHQFVLDFSHRASFSDRKLLLQFDLTQKPCFTAIKISSLSDYPEEEEVLILPGTFFSVTGIEKGADNITIILLVNVPVDESMLLTAN